VSKRNDGQRWRHALQLCAAACCRVQPLDMCSHACAYCFMVAPCTLLLGSSDTDRQAKEICCHSECARTVLIASNALATGVQYSHLHTLVVDFFLARSLSLLLSLFLSLASSPARRGGSQRLVQMRARTLLITSNALEQGFNIHTCIHWVFSVNVRPCGFMHSVSIERNILRCSSARSCTSALIIDLNVVERCACYRSLTNM